MVSSAKESSIWANELSRRSRKGALSREARRAWHSRHYTALVNSASPLEVRHRWPINMPLVIRPINDWSIRDRISINPFVHIQSQIETLQPCTFSRPRARRPLLGAASRRDAFGKTRNTEWFDDTIVVGYLQTGITSIRWEIVIDDQITPNSPERQIAYRGTASLPITAVDSTQDVLEPVVGDSIDSIVQSTLAPSLGIWRDGVTPNLQLKSCSTFDAQSIAMGILILFSIDNRIFCHAKAYWRDRPAHSNWEISPVVIEGDTEKLLTCLNDPALRAKVRVHFKGDLEMALRTFQHAKYWAGSFEIPLSDMK